MASCKYYDVGWCYAPKDIKSNDVKGACIEPEYCPYLKSQMTEKERIEGEIKILQKKLALLEELEKTKSPVEEAYKECYGMYPKGDAYWEYFKDGYNAAKEETTQEPEKSKINDLAEKLLPDDHPYKIADEHGELNPYKQGLNMIKKDKEKMEELGFVKNSDGSWTARQLGETAQELVKKLQEKEWDVDVKTNLKPQTPEQVADGLKEAFRQAIKQGIIPEVDKVSDEFMDEMVAKLKGQTLYDVCVKWNDDDSDPPVSDLIDRITEWLPKEQSAAGSQNAYVESAVDGYNDCLNDIRRKLR